jgi:hypothetical protein
MGPPVPGEQRSAQRGADHRCDTDDPQPATLTHSGLASR